MLQMMITNMIMMIILMDSHAGCLMQISFPQTLQIHQKAPLFILPASVPTMGIYYKFYMIIFDVDMLQMYVSQIKWHHFL